MYKHIIKTQVYFELITKNIYQKDKQVTTALLNIRCRQGHYYGDVKFEFNDITLYTKMILSGDSLIE